MSAETRASRAASRATVIRFMSLSSLSAAPPATAQRRPGRAAADRGRKQR